MKALAVYVLAEPLEGERCFGLGYAVAENCRNQGLAKEVVEKSIAELSLGFRKHFSKLYIETMVGQDNIASQKVSAQLISSTPKATTDAHSGQPALQYVRLLEL
ncbi:hypothetical protein FQZ97_476780 [compost metagenome]